MKRGRRKAEIPSLEFLIHLRLREGEDDDTPGILEFNPKT